MQSKHPNMNEVEQEFFAECISGKKRYVEYGAGKSTEIAKIYCDSITSIETDEEWAKKYDAYHVDLGKTGAWGYPLAEPRINQLKLYFRFAKDFDILLIDGRYRVGVALHAEPGLILIHDYEREKYHVVERFMKKIKQVDRLALFEKKRKPVVTLELLTDAL